MGISNSFGARKKVRPKFQPGVSYKALIKIVFIKKKLAVLFSICTDLDTWWNSQLKFGFRRSSIQFNVDNNKSILKLKRC